ncbi:MAG: FAD binding domain-containing protein [Treponema sp.]|jgi:CO/xanthine dehydrogenase FAD-binding subunit|nr:FAD binding domain-containing protein [Treponema sp.]
MAVPHNQVLRPGNFSELFSFWGRFPDAVPFAGGTALIRFQDRMLPELPGNILSLEKIEDLRRITRTERYLEIGTMVRLGEIIALGKTVPDAFTGALRGIGGPQVRNLATIGGNLYISGDAAAPMAALDARYELRSASGSRWISAFRFSMLSPGEKQKNRELLTRIRIPLEPWNYTVCRKFVPGGSGGEGGVLIILVQNQKDILTRIQVVFIPSPVSGGESGSGLFMDKDSERFLEGKALPLDRRDAIHYGEQWNSYLRGLGRPDPLLRAKIVNVIETGLLELSN